MPAFSVIEIKVDHHMRREAIREFGRELRMAPFKVVKKKLLQGFSVFFGSLTDLPLIFSIKGSIASSSTA